MEIAIPDWVYMISAYCLTFAACAFILMFSVGLVLLACAPIISMVNSIINDKSHL